MYKTILYTVANRVLTITLNRPDRLNAYTEEMREELIAALDAADADDNIRAIIVTGAGRAFCAGAELSTGADTFRPEAMGGAVARNAAGGLDFDNFNVRDGGGRLTLRIYQCLKPIIAAINGPAVGIGATMTLPMDIRLASDTAKIGFVFTRRGITPEAASSFFLPRLVGMSRALEWCMTGRLLNASEAREGGLVRSVHAPIDLLSAALEIAREIADNTAPVSVALARQMLWRSYAQSDPMEAHRLDSRAIFSRGESADAREGVASFLEKRRPSYPDRVSDGMPAFYPWWSEQAFG